MSLTNTGLSAGGIAWVPFASYIIVHWGLEISLPVLGVIYGLMVIFVTTFIKQRPSDLGQSPEGEPPQISSSGKNSSAIVFMPLFPNSNSSLFLFGNT